MSRPSIRISPITAREANRPREGWRLLLLDGEREWTGMAQEALAGIADVDATIHPASAIAALGAGVEAMEPHAAALIVAGPPGGDAAAIERARELWAVAPDVEIAVATSTSLRPDRFARPEQVTVLGLPLDSDRLRIAVAGAQARFTRRTLARSAGERARLSAQVAELEREVATLRDAEREKHQRAAEQLRVEKLESLGRLAGGLAHELNTPLQFIGDNLVFLAESHGVIARLLDAHRQNLRGVVTGDVLPGVALVRSDEAEEQADVAWIERQVPQALAECNEGLQRVREVVRTMKEFATPAEAGRSSCSVNEAVTRALVLARADYERAAEVEMYLSDVPAACCSSEDLHRVLTCLIVNAAKAIDDRRKTGDPRRGTIRLRTWLDGDEVVIAVTDDGCGIPDAIRSHIFEHFFTTREVGQGTGQGLALAWSLIAQKHRGTLRFESEANRGTTFEVRLPRAAA